MLENIFQHLQSYKLGHPPGAPFFQMMGAVFSMFASNNESIAIAVNFLSVVSSAFVILFLFWSTTLFLKKISKKNNFTNDTNILLSSSIGALAFTFSDSFWFNAVETEVYALQCFFYLLHFGVGLDGKKILIIKEVINGYYLSVFNWSYHLEFISWQYSLFLQ